MRSYPVSSKDGEDGDNEDNEEVWDDHQQQAVLILMVGEHESTSGACDVVHGYRT